MWFTAQINAGRRKLPSLDADVLDAKACFSVIVRTISGCVSNKDGLEVRYVYKRGSASHASVMKSETVVGFNWNDGNRENCQKHGVAIAEIEGVFKGAPQVAFDAVLKVMESRLLAIGRATNARYVLIAFAWRELESYRLIRPISARYLHANGIDAGRSNLEAIPQFVSDEDAEMFVGSTGLAGYDQSSFVPVRFEFLNEDARVRTHIPR
jgi:uncharacterized DUF497 family protein